MFRSIGQFTRFRAAAAHAHQSRLRFVLSKRCVAPAGLCVAIGACTWSIVRIATDAPRGPVSAEVAEARARAIDRLIETIDSSRGVLAVSIDEDAPYAEILLWRLDEHEPGVLNQSEVLLISYSRVLGTLCAYRLEGAESRVEGAGCGVDSSPAPRTPHPEPPTGRVVDPPIDPECARQRGFRDGWRSMPTVTPHLLCRDLSDVRIEVSEGHDGSGEVIVEVGLMWAANCADADVSRVARSTWAVLDP